ncbi:hypothetical protein FH972_024567 [Carpinus fangiana]|uniref:Zn(2)-C6 fungal-type domain-containing protein n=1 Tax=Carpinus fangiana TaxID=176857 RepID=A0A5N6KZ43_9ROSI|nr:hypothetical protein FH972_024567 [Carpinus fangiana]
MDVSRILHKESTPKLGGTGMSGETHRAAHSYPTRRGSITDPPPLYISSMAPHTVPQHIQTELEPNHIVSSARPLRGAPKQVSFQLLDSRRASLRVNVKQSEATERIVNMLKNHFGAYHTDEVSFQDDHGAPIIAHYDNWPHDGTVHVRLTQRAEPMTSDPLADYQEGSPVKPMLGAPFQMSPPLPQAHRPGSRSDIMRSTSPATSIRNTILKSHSNPMGLSILTDLHREHDQNGAHSDSDAASITSSRRARSDHLANAEISTENIVGGTRRIPSSAKFESNELPLFKPPQVPMTGSISSASPQRRITNAFGASPLPPHSFHNPQQYLLSPRSLESQPSHFGQHAMSGSRETRSSMRVPASRLSGGSNSAILPTPAPTIGSMISDEDVAYQLMRLGDPSNFSRGRTSTSTMADDALSGKAELASSVEYSDEEDAVTEQDLQYPTHHQNKKRRLVNGAVGDENVLESSADEFTSHSKEYRQSKSSSSRHTSVSHQKKKLASSVDKSRSKATSTSSIPRSLPPASRKASMSSVDQQGSLLGDDEEDLSSKPRCQRCRKSKKGCDRQRPCQRCKDAGIGADGCVSEDEGNGRKGRFGRHMGVAIKKNDVVSPSSAVEHTHHHTYQHGLPQQSEKVGIDKNKKRKR